jgi:hypothetical protein
MGWPLTRSTLSGHVEGATRIASTQVDHIRRSLHMIIELGKVTEETQNTTILSYETDNEHYLYVF